jgi:septum formation protein
VKESNVREVMTKGESAEAFCMRVAKDKAESVWEQYRSKRDDIVAVIGADTVILCEGEVIGQPSDRKDAARILRRLSGRHHKVITGVVVLFPRMERSRTFAITSTVWMHRLSEMIIADYVATNEPLGKAGAYAIQGKGANLVATYDGSYTNIVGLPVDELRQVLGEVLE